MAGAIDLGVQRLEWPPPIQKHGEFLPRYRKLQDCSEKFFATRSRVKNILNYLTVESTTRYYDEKRIEGDECPELVV